MSLYQSCEATALPEAPAILFHFLQLPCDAIMLPAARLKCIKKYFACPRIWFIYSYQIQNGFLSNGKFPYFVTLFIIFSRSFFSIKLSSLYNHLSISSYSFTCALVLVCLVRAVRADSNKRVCLVCLADFRSRLNHQVLQS